MQPCDDVSATMALMADTRKQIEKARLQIDDDRCLCERAEAAIEASRHTLREAGRILERPTSMASDVHTLA